MWFVSVFWVNALFRRFSGNQNDYFFVSCEFICISDEIHKDLNDFLTIEHQSLRHSRVYIILEIVSFLFDDCQIRFRDFSELFSYVRRLKIHSKLVRLDFRGIQNIVHLR